jgi:hypothetical protein
MLREQYVHLTAESNTLVIHVRVCVRGVLFLKHGNLALVIGQQRAWLPLLQMLSGISVLILIS